MVNKHRIILTGLLIGSMILSSMDEISAFAGTTDSVQFIINSNKIFKKQGKIKVPVLVSNKSTSCFLLYAFLYIEEGITTPETYCKGNNTAGTAIILEGHGKQIFGSFPFFDDFKKPTTWDDVISSFNNETKSFVRKKLILPPKNSVAFKLTLSLKHFVDLPPGIYELNLIYYCGYNLDNIVDPDQQIADCKKYNAEVFKGYLVTNKIKLEVK